MKRDAAEEPATQNSRIFDLPETRATFWGQEEGVLCRTAPPGHTGTRGPQRARLPAASGALFVRAENQRGATFQLRRTANACTRLPNENISQEGKSGRHAACYTPRFRRNPADALKQINLC